MSAAGDYVCPNCGASWSLPPGMTCGNHHPQQTTETANDTASNHHPAPIRHVPTRGDV